MTGYDFIDKLTERYGTPKNAQFTADIIGWINQEQPDLDRLYVIVVDNHEYESFPNRAKLRMFWQNFGSGKSSDRTKEIIESIKRFNERWSLVGARRIYDTYCHILKIPSEGRTSVHREFMNQWEVIYYHWTRLVEEGRPADLIEKYCEKVRESIVNGTYRQEEFNEEAERQGERVGLVRFEDAVKINFHGVR